MRIDDFLTVFFLVQENCGVCGLYVKKKGGEMGEENIGYVTLPGFQGPSQDSSDQHHDGI